MSSHDNNPTDGAIRNRRGSFTQQTFSSIFGGRPNSIAEGTTPTSPFPSAISTTGATTGRRMSVSAALGLSGTSPVQTTAFPFGARRGSVSTAGSNSINESAIDDDEDTSRSVPTTPFDGRRMSFGAPGYRRAPVVGSPGTNGTESSGFNWSEQLRSRAESAVSHTHRPSFSTSPSTTKPMVMHERTKSVSDLPAPPTAVPPPAARPAPRPARKQPDAFQERILKGDFYMD